MSISSAANSPPLIVAHRGVSEDFPENTSAAFAAAIDSRADAIECDLQLTTDGQIVVCHDFGLQRYGHPDVIVSETSLQDLQRLDIGSWFAPQFSAERLLSLEQMLQNHGHRMPLWLEVKVPSGGESRIDHFCRKLVQTLAEYDLQHRVTVLSFDRSVLRRVSELDSEIELTLNTHQPQALTAADLQAQPWLSGVDGNIKSLDEAAVRSIRDQQLAAFTFTCNTRDEVRKAYRIGCDAIVTNSPERIRELLRQDVI